MTYLEIIWPALAMAGLTYGVWFTRQVQRFVQMRKTPPTSDDLATREAGLRYFASAENASNNLINLFEMPVLFYALVPLLLIAQRTTAAQVALAWLFFLLRFAHSVLHIAGGRVSVRFAIYLASCAVLLAMWIGLGVDLANRAPQAPR